jgi:hypothetical protein
VLRGASSDDRLWEVFQRDGPRQEICRFAIIDRPLRRVPPQLQHPTTTFRGISHLCEAQLTEAVDDWTIPSRLTMKGEQKLEFIAAKPPGIYIRDLQERYESMLDPGQVKVPLSIAPSSLRTRLLAAKIQAPLRWCRTCLPTLAYRHATSRFGAWFWCIRVSRQANREVCNAGSRAGTGNSGS